MPAYNTAKEKPHKGYLCVEEAAEALGIDRSTLRGYIQQGRITAIRKRWYYGNTTGRNLRSAYYIKLEEVKRFAMLRVVEKYARPTAWVRAKDDPAAILEAGE